MTTTLMTGLTGQDRSDLAGFLLAEKGIRCMG